MHGVQVSLADENAKVFGIMKCEVSKYVANLCI